MPDSNPSLIISKPKTGAVRVSTLGAVLGVNGSVHGRLAQDGSKCAATIFENNTGFVTGVASNQPYHRPIVSQATHGGVPMHQTPNGTLMQSSRQANIFTFNNNGGEEPIRRTLFFWSPVKPHRGLSLYPNIFSTKYEAVNTISINYHLDPRAIADFHTYNPRCKSLSQKEVMGIPAHAYTQRLLPVLFASHEYSPYLLNQLCAVPKWEWAHLLAYSLSANNPQRQDNLFCAPALANTQMLIPEIIAEKLLKSAIPGLSVNIQAHFRVIARLMVGFTYDVMVTYQDRTHVYRHEYDLLSTNPNIKNAASDINLALAAMLQTIGSSISCPMQPLQVHHDHAFNALQVRFR
jgi:hypothetical protein